MATSTGSRALDFALGIGAYAPQVDLPDDVLPPQQAPEDIVRRSGKVSPNSAEFAPLIKKAAEKYNIPYELLMGVAQQESSFNPNAVGPSTKYGHAKGMFQLIDATAKRYGVRNPFDPEDAAQGSARYLRDLMDRYNNDPKLAIAAYNAGEGNVDKYLRGERDLPDQTKDYLPKVMGHMAAFTGGQGMPAAAPGVEPGMRQIMLTNGSPMVVPEAMTNEQVLEHIRKSPNPELSRLAPAQEVAIDGKNVLVPFNMTNEDEIRHHMVNEGVLPDPTAGKGGRYWNNMVSGLETMLGNAALSTGNKEMAQQFYDKARAGEYQMYESEVDAAKRRGMLPGLMAEAKQNLLYPGATMLGQYAPAMVRTSGLLGAAAKLAAMTPSATGEVMRYAQERGVDISPEEALRQGIPLAAVESFGLPLKGVGGAAGAAEKGLLRRTAEAGATNFAKNVAAMTAMEGLQKAGAGEPVLPQTPEEMKRIAEAAAWFAGPHAIGAGLMPRAVEEAPRSDIGAMRPEPRREVPTEPVEPEMVREEPTVEPTTVTRTQNEIIGEAYADHVRNSMARGEEPMAPEEFFQREANQIRETEAAGAAPPTEIIQPYLDLAAQRPAAEPTPYTPKSREVPGAEQVVETGAPDGRRSAQPGFREEGRDQAVGGQGVEPSGQGVKAPEVRGEEIKAPEAEAPVSAAEPREFPKTKPPSEVYPALPFIPKVELDRLPEEHRVEYHQMRGEALKKLKPAQVELLSERDKLDYHQYKGLHNAEIAKEMGYSGREETLRKLEEHELQNLEVGLNKPMSKAREDYLEAQREERAKYREVEEGQEDRPDYWKENPNAPDDASSWQDTFGGIHHDVSYDLPSGNKIVGVVSQPANDAIALRIKTPKGEKFWPLNLYKRNGRLFWKGDEKTLAKSFGPELADTLLKHNESKIEDYDELYAKSKEIADEIRDAAEGKKEAELEAENLRKEETRAEKKAGKFEEDEEGVYELPEFDYTEPDRELDYTKGEAPREAHTPESLAQHISAEYGARRPAVEITTREKAGVDANTKAFYDPKTKRVHLIADNLGKGDSIHGILKHEIGVHAQKLGVKDPEFQGILRHMQGMQAKGIKAVREAYAKVPEGTRPERIHEEALGYLVEHHPNIPLVRRFMSWLRRMAHKLTGNAGWLKPEDLSQMAHRILKKDYGVESRPERRDVQTEKLRSVRDDNIKAIRERGITKTEKTLTYKETGAKALEFAKEAKKNFRTEIVDTTDPMTRHLQELDRFIPELGKLRADAIAIEANQGVGLVGHAIEAGIPVINKSGSMMVVPGANLKSAIEFAKSKEKGGEELLSFVLRVNIGEHRIKEHAQDIKDIARLREDIMNLEHMEKFHKKLGFMKERDKVKKELEAKKSNLNTIFRERNIDPETMEGREKLVDANDIALRDKIMKDHPWLDQPVKEIYTAMQGLVDFYKDSGMIDKITADKWKEAPYIPLYKSLEDLAKDPNFKKLFPRTAESLHEIQQIKGFKHSVNVLENLHKHYYGMMLPAIFNHTRKQFVEQSLHLDALHKMNEEPGLSYDRALRKATEATQKYKGSKNTVKVMENGEEKHFVVQDPDLLHMLSFERPEIGPVARFFRPGATVKRTMFLKNPGFWGTQLLLDPLFANLTAGSKHLIHPGQAIGNLFKIWMGKSEGGKALEAHGVDVGHHDYAGEKALSYAGMGEATQFHELFGKKSMFRKAMNLLDKVHNTVDEATRVAVYDAVKKDGKKMGLSGQALEDYAVDRARRYINFSARGKNNVLNEYRAMTAFTSAAINGADALVRNARGYGLNAKEAKEVRQIFWKRFMAGMAIGTGAAIAQLGSYDGDKNGDLYDQLTSINLGEGFKIPMKWDVGALVYGLPKVFVMTTMLDSSDPNSLTVRQGTKAAFDLIVKNMFPPVHLPDMINPLVEAVANRHLSLEDTDYIESPGSLRYAADARGRTNTFLGEFFGNLVGVSGKKADYIGRNYLGKFYEFSNAVAGAITDRSAGMPGAEMAIPKTLGAGTFMQDTNRVYGADRIYDAEERAQQELAAFNKFRTQNKDKLEEFKQDKERMLYKNAAPMLRNVRENLGAIEKRISQIMDSKAPAAAKESQIKQLTERKRALVEQGNKLIKQRLGEYAP